MPRRNARSLPAPPSRASELSAQLEAARRALSIAAQAEQSAETYELAARAKETDAVEQLAKATTSAGGLLSLCRHGSGSVWMFAKGTWDNPMIVAADVALQAARLAPPVYAALIEDRVDETLTMHLKGATYCSDWSTATHAGQNARILREQNCKHVLDAATCDRLRSKVDAERDRTKDTVDGFAQHQLSMSLSDLQVLIGEAAMVRLRGMPDALLAQRSRDARARAIEAASHAKASRTGAATAAENSQAVLARAIGEARTAGALASSAAADGYQRINVFIRRYSRDTRPWIGFHTDLSTVTVNVALSADASHEGGHLHAILDGKHQMIEREEGEATVHGDDVMHGVSAMRGGVRYALILFFFRE